MNQKKLSLWLKAIIICVGICGIVIYFGILPNIGDAFHAQFPEFAAWHWPWLIFLWCTAIPCYAVLVLGWKIATGIGGTVPFPRKMLNSYSILPGWSREISCSSLWEIRYSSS